MNKKLFTIGSLLSAIPVVAVVSCSTTWTKWEEDKNAKQTMTKFKREFAAQVLWKVRPDVELNAAWDAGTKTLDVTKLNNQFELIQSMINILDIKSPDKIDSYWNDMDRLKTYLNKINKKLDFKIKDENGEHLVHWDITDVINNAVKGIDDWVTGGNLASEKAYDVEKNGLVNGQPKDMTEVALVGGSLITNGVVQALMGYDTNFAMDLSKLVNLPKATFDNFKHLMTAINKLFNDIWSQIKSSTWVQGLDFNLGTNGKIDTYKNGTPNKQLTLLKGMFIIKSLK